MSLGRNIVANYASQLYVSLVGLLVLPLYLRYLGAEAYGLVGFFMLLQSWFMLLDFGLTPTVGREMARHRAGATDGLSFRRLYRALLLIFLGIALCGGGLLFFSAEWLAARWLQAEALELPVVVQALQVMAACVALRWMCGLFRSVVAGSERLVWLSGFNVVVSTLRFLLVIPAMWLYGATPEVFFNFQLGVGLIEFSWIGSMALRLLPRVAGSRIGWSLAPVRPVLKFALSIAFASTVWVLVTQTDRLVLSGILSLSEYGYYSLAVLVASGIMLISGPVSSAILPRMARLHAEGSVGCVLDLYGAATQWVAVVAGAAAITMVYCAEPLLLAWTGEPEVAREVAPVLALYAAGNGFLALAAFPFYLQYARGDLRLHLIGNAVIALVLLPAIVVVALRHGAIGAGWVWLITNAACLLFWVAFVHSRLQPGFHGGWIRQDVAAVLLPAAALAGATLLALPTPATRWSALANCIAVAVAALLGAGFGSRDVRRRTASLVRGRRLTA